ncbi:MAG: hypothetical protein K0R73_495 [Candidatus Midichloriaceae bacterium]|jgi:hypothetical protein|nr:hypothetical protein [Candidatus Midichloriaceae bacterium]
MFEQRSDREDNPIDIVLSAAAWKRVKQYAKELSAGEKTAGTNLTEYCSRYLGKQAKELNSEELLQALLGTKEPTVYAESVKIGKDTWNATEYEILCSVGIMYDVVTYDNGRWGGGNWSDFKVYDEPFEQLAMIVSSPILALPGGEVNPDRQKIWRGQGWDLGPCPGSKGNAAMQQEFLDYINANNVAISEEIKEEISNLLANFNENNEEAEEGIIALLFDTEAYYAILEERLLPLLVRASQRAEQKGEKLVLTLPGLGCGAFAGSFKGKVGDFLNQALKRMLDENHGLLKNIDTIIFDGYDECSLEQGSFGHIKYRVRSYARKEEGAESVKKVLQYSSAEEYQEGNEDFKSHKKAKIVAGDGFSIPGNDANRNSRFTDEGAFGAATNSAQVISGGIEGKYSEHGKINSNPPFFNPAKGGTWEEVFNAKLENDRKPIISIENGFMVLQKDGNLEVIKPNNKDIANEIADLHEKGNEVEQALQAPQAPQETKTNGLWAALSAFLVGAISFYASYKARNSYFASSTVLGFNGMAVDACVAITGISSVVIASCFSSSKDAGELQQK